VQHLSVTDAAAADDDDMVNDAVQICGGDLCCGSRLLLSIGRCGKLAPDAQTYFHAYAYL